MTEISDMQAGHQGRDGFLEERNRNSNPGSPDLMPRTHAVAVLQVPGQGQCQEMAIRLLK